MMTEFLLTSYFTVPVTIESQFIEVSTDSVHVGDVVTLNCLLTDGLKPSDVTSYAWYLNSKFHEMKNRY